MAGLNIKNIPTGPGDDIKVDASWAKGDTKNVIATSGTSPSFAMFGNSGPAYQSVGFGLTSDAVYTPVGVNGSTSGSLHLTESYGVRGAFNHNWDPYWSSSLYGSSSAVHYDDTAKASICANYTTAGKAVGGVIAFTCNPDFNVSQLGVNTRWTPVKNLTFTAGGSISTRSSRALRRWARAPRSPRPSTSSRTRIPTCSRFALSVTSDPRRSNESRAAERQRGFLFAFAGYAAQCRKSQGQRSGDDHVMPAAAGTVTSQPADRLGRQRQPGRSRN
jgi:hypothetical protein